MIVTEQMQHAMRDQQLRLRFKRVTGDFRLRLRARNRDEDVADSEAGKDSTSVGASIPR